MDDKLKKGEIKITVIATGFDDFLSKKQERQRFKIFHQLIILKIDQIIQG